MDEPFKSSTDPAKRFMDIVPSNQTTVSPISRPIISPKAEPPVDPMVAAKPVAQTSSQVSQNKPAEKMMQREYQEVEHELPAGETLSSGETIEPQMTPVIGDHAGQRRKHSALDKFILFVLALIILALILDILLDHGNLKLSGIPHTHFWHKS